MTTKFLIFFRESAKFFALVFFALFLSYYFAVYQGKAKGANAQVSGALSGYAWSDNIGWVSLNCSNNSSCATSSYAISVDPTSGDMSGYAWSDNIGWISANSADISGCPSGTCTPNLQNGTMTGWLKALAGGSGGWDGWISLSGQGYGITQNGNAFSGYAWGSDVIGWLDFSLAVPPLTCAPAYSCPDSQTIQYTSSSCQVSTYATCASPGFCSAGSSTCVYPQPSFVSSAELSGHLQVRPTLVQNGNTVKIYWNLDNVSSCAVAGTNGDSWTGGSSGSAGKVSSPITDQTTYTLSCTALPGASPSSITETQIVNLVPSFQEK